MWHFTWVTVNLSMPPGLYGLIVLNRMHTTMVRWTRVRWWPHAVISGNPILLFNCFPSIHIINGLTNKMKTGTFKLRYRPYTLELKHVFTVASASRRTTPAVLTELEFEGITGYGEAAMPPYL